MRDGKSHPLQRFVDRARRWTGRERPCPARSSEIRLSKIRLPETCLPETCLHEAAPLAVEQLEERILLSATPLAAIPDAPADGSFDLAPMLTDDQAATSGDASDPSSAEDAGTKATQNRIELVVIDASAVDVEAFINDLTENPPADRELEILILDETSDGIDQITDALTAIGDVDALHLVTHGSEGRIKIGDTWLSMENAEGYAGAIARWGDGLSDRADLLIYGCDLAQTEGGRSLVAAIASLSGADVAASDDDTGARSLGGDWDLEYHVGEITTDVVFSSDLQDRWHGLLDTFVVTTTSDSGAGSLRAAIDAANAKTGFDKITFNIAGSGVQTIGLASALPAITDAVIIDGSTQPNHSGTPLIELDGTSAGLLAHGLEISGGGTTVRGLAIGNFGGTGIYLHSAGGNILVGNFIGVGADGSTPMQNGGEGIWIDDVSNNRIGGKSSGDGNLIVGNAGSGIRISGSGATGNRILGNFIGTNQDGTLALGNSVQGVLIEAGASQNRIGGVAAGAGNRIANNTAMGVLVTGGTGNAIRGNAIYANGSLGIDLDSSGIIGELLNGSVTANDSGDADTGPNLLQNFPELSYAVTSGTVVTVAGKLNSTPNATLHVDFYSSPSADGSGYGEGQTYLDSYTVTTDAAGTAVFAIELTQNVPEGHVLTATATDADGNTSEFSLAIAFEPHQVYWGDKNGILLQANLDGTNAQTLIGGLKKPSGLVVDPIARKVYWADESNKTISRADLDGTNQELLISGLGTPEALEIDLSTGKLYWADYGTGMIQRSDLDGTNIETLLSGLSKPTDLSIDIAGGKLYWAEETLGRIQSSNLDGTSVTEVVTGLNKPQGIALDIDNGRLYWTDMEDDSLTAAPRIASSRLDGSDVQVHLGGLSKPKELAVRGRADELIWGDLNDLAIYRSDLSGANRVTLVSGAGSVGSIETLPALTFRGTPPAPNNAPMANAGGPYSIVEGEDVTLSGAQSTDEDGDPLTITWDLDADGAFDDAVGTSVTLTWDELRALGIDDDGTYTLAVHVDDGRGGTDTAQTTLAVANGAPTLNVSGASTVQRGAEYTLNLSATDSGQDTVTAWRVDWGDGTVETFAGAAPTVSHAYLHGDRSYAVMVAATDEDGTFFNNPLIAASAATDHLIRYAPDGTVAGEFGAGNQDYPSGLVIGPAGKLYVTGALSDTVLQYDAKTGVFEETVVTAGAGSLNRPSGVAIGPDGLLYVSSEQDDRVLRFDRSTGAFVDTFVAAGAGGLDQPTHLGFGPDGNLYVASTATAQILRYDGETGEFIDAFVDGAGDGLAQPRSFVFGPDGHLYIAGSGGDSILRYDGTSGAFVDTFVAAGAGGLDAPSGLAFAPDGNLYATSSLSDEILVFDGATGGFVKRFAGAGNLDDPAALVFVSNTRVFVAAPTAPALLSSGDMEARSNRAGEQTTAGASRGSTSAVAMLDSGRFVTAWSSHNGVHYTVEARIYDSDGVPITAEFQVNQYDPADQRHVGVAADESGNFVITWTSAGQDGSGDGVFARRYDREGNPLGAEFQVNSSTNGDQLNSDVAMNADGSFVIVWQGRGSGDTMGIYARRYDASGAAQDVSEWRVNDVTGASQANPAVGIDAEGGFVVVWDDTSGFHARRFAADGTPLGNQFVIDAEATAGNGDVALANNGDFVVTWRTDNAGDGDSQAVYAARYDTSGVRLGAVIAVNETTAGAQTNPSVAIIPGGGFLVTYEGAGTGDADGVFSRAFDDAGNPLTGEQRINQTTTSVQQFASAAVVDQNNYVVVWTKSGATVDAGVYQRIYGEADNRPVADAGGPYSIDEGSGVTLDGSGSTDPNGDPLTFTWDLDGDGVFGDAAGAVVTLSWNQLAGFGMNDDGTYTLFLQVSDGTYSDTQSAALQIANLPPTLNDDSGNGFIASEDGPAITTPNVLTNDSDPNPLDGLTLTAVNTTMTVGGVVSHGDGTFTYDPQGQFESLAAGEQAADRFTYTVSDGDGGLSTGTVTIQVQGVNDAPTVDPIADRTILEDAGPQQVAVTIGDVDTPASDLTLTATSDNQSLIADGSFTWLGSGTDRRLMFIPAADASGTATITVTVGDGALASSETFAVTVTPVNDAPTVDPIADRTILEDAGPQQVAVTIGDVDTPAGDLRVTATSDNQSLIADGSFTWSGSGTDRQLTFTPAADAHGTATITVTVSDGELTSSEAFAVTVTPVNDAPTMSDRHARIFSDARAGTRVLRAQAADVDGDTLSYRVVGGDGLEHFQIDSKTGVITVAEEADLESLAGGEVRLLVEARDPAGAAVTASMVITVEELVVAPPTGQTASAPSTTSTAAESSSAEETSRDAEKTPAESAEAVAPNLAPRGDGGATAASTANASEPTGQVAERFAIFSAPGFTLDAETSEEQRMALHSVAEGQSERAGSNSRSQRETVGRGGSNIRGADAEVLELLSVESTFWNELDQTKQEHASAMNFDSLVIGSTASVASGLSVGYVLWTIRGGLLVSSLMAQMPAWRMIDPLVVLESLGDADGEDEDDSLQALLEADEDTRSESPEGAEA